MKTAFLKTCSRLGLSRIARGLTGHGVRILAYHGFCDGDEARFQPMLFMRAQTFRARMQRLLESGHRVISLAEAVRRLEARDIEPGLAVITIDDGWHGIHEHAWPVLRELDLPATVYVCSYYAQCQLPVLNVFARYLVWRSPLPVVALDGLAPGLAGRQALADRAARNLLADNLSGHADAMLAPAERLAFMRTVAARLEVDIEPVLARRTFHLMSPAQLGELAATGVALELHTHRHRFPPEDRAACDEEIERNRRFLAGHHRHEVDAFLLSEWRIPFASEGVAARAGGDERHHDPTWPELRRNGCHGTAAFSRLGRASPGTLRCGVSRPARDPAGTGGDVAPLARGLIVCPAPQ